MSHLDLLDKSLTFCLLFSWQHEGHNIFAHLSSSEYKQVLGYIKDCILATDLATFFGNKAVLNKIVEDGGFQVENPEHRYSITRCL